MNDFFLVVVIAAVASFLTYLGAPAAERFTVPERIVSAALQFAAGIITALVVISLMPPALRNGPTLGVILAFFFGGALFVVLEYTSTRRTSVEPGAAATATSIGLYIGVLADVLIDGVVIGLGSSLTFATGLLLAIGLAVSTAPLAFVTIATAKRQGVSAERRRLLSFLFFGCMFGGALVGYLLLRNQPEVVKLVLIALASGFLLTTVAQSILPEAKRDSGPSLAGILFVGGLALYAFLTLYL